jgi:arginase family enzyme
MELAELRLDHGSDHGSEHEEPATEAREEQGLSTEEAVPLVERRLEGAGKK